MKILLISASTRKGRNSHRVTLMIRSKLQSLDQDVDILDLDTLDVPLFRERFIDMKKPSSIMKSVFDRLQSSDAIIIITPEYNSSITPGLKNIIDIYGRQGFGNKPIAIASVSSGIKGGIVAALHLQHIILSINGILFSKILTTGKVAETIDKNGRITDMEYLQIADNFIHRYIEFVELNVCKIESRKMKCA